MPTASFQPKLRRLIYFKAPSDAKVTPIPIPPETEIIEIVTAGTVYFLSDGADRKLSCGAMLWHIAGEKTIHRTEASSPYECLALAFSTPRRHRRPAPRLSLIPDHQRVKELCGELLQSYHDAATDRGIFEAYAHARLRWEAHLGSTQRIRQMRPPSIDAALACIEAQFSTPGLSLRDIAAAGGISEPHLHTLFREYVGESPHQFLTNRRMRMAKWLLTTTDSTIKSVSANCGYANIETFYRTFRRSIGTTPHEFVRVNSSPILSNDEIPAHRDRIPAR